MIVPDDFRMPPLDVEPVFFRLNGNGPVCFMYWKPKSS